MTISNEALAITLEATQPTAAALHAIARLLIADSISGSSKDGAGHGRQDEEPGRQSKATGKAAGRKPANKVPDQKVRKSSANAGPVRRMLRPVHSSVESGSGRGIADSKKSRSATKAR